MVAVGGYGRGELAPHSDLDLVLLHADETDVSALADKIWYPFWDAGVKVDHAVRSELGALTAAEDDLKVALGMLDLRHVAGDPHLTLRLRTTLLATWRREARRRLPALAELVGQRHRLVGELAHASVPDLKESAGGLRDAGVLKALVATWLVDVPHAALEGARQELLDARDVVHVVAGRGTDRVAPEMWEPIAAELGLADALAAQMHVRELGRRVTHLSRLTWRRVDAVLARPTSPRSARQPALEPLGHGLALSSGEVVLDRGATPAADPSLLLRAAAVAAERSAELSPATASRLVTLCPPLPEPWPNEARELLVRLLASGPGLLSVWETLEETGGIDRLLPEWREIRLLPHASAIHRFTVDRHVVETCIEASALIRDVARPDVLLVAALLHDIGKGSLTEHSIAGAPIARAVASRWGLPETEADLIARLVRWHLLLGEQATTRDPEDPATADFVMERLGSVETLDLLELLTEADAKAASAKAWSSWRERLVRQLAAACRRRGVAADPLAVHPAAPTPAGSAPPTAMPLIGIPRAVRKHPSAPSFEVESGGPGSRVRVIAGDRIGLLADVAATFAMQRVGVHTARVWTQDAFAISEWELADDWLDPAVLRQRFAAISDGRLDVHRRLSRTVTGGLEPTVAIRPEASRTATVLEVRTSDRTGVVYLVAAALATLEITIRSAHVATVGPQAVDVFYVREADAGALTDTRAADAAHAIRRALTS